MYIIINSGSSSIKFKIFNNLKEKEQIAEGLAERISIDGKLTIKYQNQEHEYEDALENHEKAVKTILDKLLLLKVINNYDEIEAIGSRVVHGGDKITKSVIINKETKEIIKNCIKLAPLHNPGALVAIEAFEKIIPSVMQVGSFDTSFHQTIAPEQFLYPVPNAWYEDLEIRKYGFHGISYQYICQRYAEAFKKPANQLNLVICHLGNGSSICCVKNGVSYDTTMGFTPLAGLMMGTRSGDIDPSILEYVCKETGKTIFEVTEILNKKSGLLGMSEISSDMRDVTQGMENNNPKAKVAFEMFTNKVSEFVIKYLNNFENKKVDGIVFTAGIGENSAIVRKAIIDKIRLLNLKIDDKKNVEKYDDFKEISTSDSEVKIFAFRTNEEKMILNDIEKLK